MVAHVPRSITVITVNFGKISQKRRGVVHEKPERIEMILRQIVWELN